MTERELSVFKYICRDADANAYFDSEAALLKEAKDIVAMLGCLVVREESQIKGRSDLLLCYNGCFIACELKDREGTPSPHQIKFIKDVRKAGGAAGICRSRYEVFMLVVEKRWTSEI